MKAAYLLIVALLAIGLPAGAASNWKNLKADETGTPDRAWKGGNGLFEIQGVLGGATVKLQRKLAPIGDYKDVTTITTRDGAADCDLTVDAEFCWFVAPGDSQIHPVVVGGDGTTDITVMVSGADQASVGGGGDGGVSGFTRGSIAVGDAAGGIIGHDAVLPGFNYTLFNQAMIGGFVTTGLVLEGSTSSRIFLIDSGAPANEKVWVLHHSSGTFTLESLNDETSITNKDVINIDTSTGNICFGCRDTVHDVELARAGQATRLELVVLSELAEGEIWIGSNASDEATLRFFEVAKSRAEISSSSNEDLIFRTSSALVERVIIEAGGDVVIGTVAANAKLTVGGTGDISMAYTTAPSPTVGFGKIFPTTLDTLVFLDDDGVQHTVAFTGGGRSSLFTDDLDGGVNDWTAVSTAFEKQNLLTLGIENGTVSGSVANDELTVSVAGNYQVYIYASMSGTSGREIQCCVFAGVDTLEARTHVCIGRTMGTASAVGSAGSTTGTLALAADDRLEYHCKTDNATTTIDFWFAGFGALSGG